ncbi:Hypothetical Protein FCC1311_083542 [Hondaea fermentalgiana]|uniref:Uncharacterized protein n=1 Tax=Hondaea fermentalgiana TaxID=2315210 RepID=A0A2R5GP96_9STRA|nr:Hypothetical Protein FCC1311_083542 [Hondaea fermentalgiana]|eukprot:GBG32129.1 Hypothetical Protein FCC1311_083542 [Hondaea fermentalgiana]
MSRHASPEAPRRAATPRELESPAVSNSSSRSSDHELTDSQSARSSGADSNSNNVLIQFSPELHANLKILMPTKSYSSASGTAHELKPEEESNLIAQQQQILMRQPQKSRVQAHGEALKVDSRPHGRVSTRGGAGKRPFQEMARDSKPNTAATERSTIAPTADSSRAVKAEPHFVPGDKQAGPPRPAKAGPGNPVSPFAGDAEAREDAVMALRVKLANMPVHRKGGVALLHFDDLLEMLDAHGVDVATLDAETVHHLQTIINVAASEIVLDICAQKKQRIATSKHLSISAPDVQEAVTSLAKGRDGFARNPSTSRFYSYIDRCEAKLGVLDPRSTEVRANIVSRRENPVSRSKKKRKGAAAAAAFGPGPKAVSSSSSSMASSSMYSSAAHDLPSSSSAQGNRTRHAPSSTPESSMSDASMLMEFANTANGQAPPQALFPSVNAVHPGFVETHARVNPAFENPDSTRKHTK